MTTRFYPLRWADAAGEEVQGPVVRVAMPRAVLASFGLPMDQERAREPVQADVVLDDTGMARAIRFVRP
jgi:hypothetical protein